MIGGQYEKQAALKYGYGQGKEEISSIAECSGAGILPRKVIFTLTR